VLADGPLPDPATLARLLKPAPTERPAHEQSRVEPLRERVLALHERGVEGQAIWQLLVEEHGFTGSYSSVKRFLRRLTPGPSRATLRLEVPPGDEAQVDFGFAGQFLDPESGRVRRAWVFVMTLSCSRHQYAELVFDQTIATWLRLHRAAFEFFGGVPRRVVLEYVARHIFELMCPPSLCGLRAQPDDWLGWTARAGPHNRQREFSHASKDSSVRQTGF